ncbi:hypothetical protein KR222_000099 [Zaprionus bogoriensis]|nr:hypothetical protein KR222_000099 [Zaprionus bogoriensis]
MEVRWVTIYFAAKICMYQHYIPQGGKYKVTIEQFTFLVAPDQTTADVSNLFLMGRDRVVNGTVILFEDVDDSFTIEAEYFTDATGTGNFMRAPFDIPTKGFCQGLLEFSDALEATLRYGENTNFPANGKECPIKKGTYYFHNIRLDTKGWPKQIPRGHIKCIFTAKKGKIPIGRFEIILHVEDSLV